MVPSRSLPVFATNSIFLIPKSSTATALRLSAPLSRASRASSPPSFFVARPIRLLHRSYSVQAANPLSYLPPRFKKPSLLRRILTTCAIATLSLCVGIGLSPIPETMTKIAVQLGAEETPFEPQDDIAREIDEYIDNHPLAHSLRQNAEFTESRPHMKIPVAMRRHNLTAGTLAGPDKIVVPPYIWSEAGGKSLVSMLYLGTDVSGHPGLVHGGLLATVLDETLARCCFPALPNGIGVTANLNINYRSPAPAGSYFVVRAETERVEGRKAFVKGWIETLPDDGKEPVIVAEATALFVEPKNVAALPSLYKAMP
ncbi:hypothetical protein AJ79_10213 [Helicocarpus griseus UAMH5409]|uniref:Thioesterase domain-containing protein n=1 Tax=Helicocarpus griseus UAMH5409 TaxID=1447875 RepID=A0A2B7W6N4_9EURO|nr:hypothetical protein AJ79_10213 [Helicocarpus griseus UAMH5409]